MAFVLTADQRVRVTADVVDAYQNPLVTGTPPSFASTDPAIVRLDPVAEDAFAVYAVAVGPVGTTTVRATLGDLVESVEIEVVAGSAARLRLTVGGPEAK